MNHTDDHHAATHNAYDSDYLAYLAERRAFLMAVYQSPVTQAALVLNKVFIPCLLLLGGFGNVANIFVLRRTKDSSSSQHVFLIALAVADIVFLCSRILIQFVYDYFKVHVWTVHTAACKLLSYLYGVSTTLSAWLVTAVTVQRTLAVTWPHKIRMMCTVRRTWTVVSALVFTACALRFDILVIHEIENNECNVFGTTSYYIFVQYIRPWLTLCLFSFMPFVCLLVCDVLLSLSLFQATSASSVANQAMSNAPSVHSDNSRRETAKRTTVMILALSVSFLLLTMPIQTVIIWYNFNSEDIINSPQLFSVSYLMRAVCFLLVYTNSAINFFLYCFTGTRFRREFLSWICCSVTDHSSGSVGKTTRVSSKGKRTKQHDSTLESTLSRT